MWKKIVLLSLFVCACTGPMGPAGQNGHDGKDGSVGPQGPVGMSAADVR